MHRRAGQRGQDDNLVPVPDEQGRAYLAHDWLQRGGGGLEERPLHHVGPRRSRIPESSVAHGLL